MILRFCWVFIVPQKVVFPNALRQFPPLPDLQVLLLKVCYNHNVFVLLLAHEGSQQPKNQTYIVQIFNVLDRQLIVIIIRYKSTKLKSYYFTWTSFLIVIFP